MSNAKQNKDLFLTKIFVATAFPLDNKSGVNVTHKLSKARFDDAGDNGANHDDASVDVEDDDDTETEVQESAKRGRRSTATNEKIKKLTFDISSMITQEAAELRMSFKSLLKAVYKAAEPIRRNKENNFNKFSAIMAKDGITDREEVAKEYQKFQQNDNWAEQLDTNYKLIQAASGQTTLVARKSEFKKLYENVDMKVSHHCHYRKTKSLKLILY